MKIDKEKRFLEIKEIIKNKNGKLLSGEYVNQKSKLLIECENKHIWYGTAHNLYNGHWCRKCASIQEPKYSMRDMQKIVSDKGGSIVDKDFFIKNNKSKIKIQCSQGHEWETSIISLVLGYWCHKCHSIFTRFDQDKIENPQLLKLRQNKYKELTNIVSKRGGKCLFLEEDYVGALSKLKFECSVGHNWLAKPNNIKTGYWCPYCSEGLYEKICRQMLNEIFQTNFVRRRDFDWLRNVKNFNLELDGYAENVSDVTGKLFNVAFEHNGMQHYFQTKKFHKDEFSLKKIKEHDSLKIKLCEENSVLLIVIPELVSMTKLSDLQNVIINQAKKKNFLFEELPIIDYNIFYGKDSK